MWIPHCLARCILRRVLLMFPSRYHILYPHVPLVTITVYVMVMLQKSRFLIPFMGIWCPYLETKLMQNCQLQPYMVRER